MKVSRLSALRLTQMVLALLTFLIVACTGSSQDQTNTAPQNRTPSGTPSPVQGLDFPGSAGVTTTLRFKFDHPELNGLPIYGPNGQGVTYIWQAYPRQQFGYYTAFFWGNDDGKGNTNDTFLWKSGQADSYYGAHPYPDTPPNGSTHQWEIALEQNDFVNGAVVYDRWYTQALRVWADASGAKHHEFYWDLPNTDAGHMVIRVSPASWGNVTPPAAALTWGDAPWNPGKEVWDGVLRGIQIYNQLLSLDEIQLEISTPLSTPSGANSIWYLNVNPTPGDIADKSGKNHNPSWVGGELPRLYAQSRSSTMPALEGVTLELKRHIAQVINTACRTPLCGCS